MSELMVFEDDSDDESHLPDIRISKSIFEVDPDEEGECESIPTRSYQLEIEDNSCINQIPPEFSPQLAKLINQTNFAQQLEQQQQQQKEQLHQQQLMPPPPPPLKKSHRNPVLSSKESYEDVSKTNRHKQNSSTGTSHSSHNNKSSSSAHSRSRSKSKQKSAFLDSSNFHISNLPKIQEVRTNVQKSLSVISSSSRSSSNSGGMVNNDHRSNSNSAALLNLQRKNAPLNTPTSSHRSSTSSLSIINHRKPSRSHGTYIQIPSISTSSSSSSSQVQVSTRKPELKGLAKEYPKLGASLANVFILAKCAKRRIKENKNKEAKKLLNRIKDQLAQSCSALEIDEKGNKKQVGENMTCLPLEEKTFYYMLIIFLSDLIARKCFLEDEIKEINIILNMLRRLIYRSSQANYKTSLINILNFYHKTIGNNNADGNLDLFRNSRLIISYDMMKVYKDDTPICMMLPDYRIGVDGFLKKIVRVIKHSKMCTKETDKRKLLNTLVALMKIWRSNDFLYN